MGSRAHASETERGEEAGGGRAARLQELLDGGLLLHWESLLSTVGGEEGMLGDCDAAVREVREKVVYRLLPRTTTSAPSGGGLRPPLTAGGAGAVELRAVRRRKELEEEGGAGAAAVAGLAAAVEYVAELAVEVEEGAGPAGVLAVLRAAPVLRVTSVLFTQGINEMQSLANRLPARRTAIQRDINRESLAVLREHFQRPATQRRVAAGGHEARHDLEDLMRQVEDSVAATGGGKNVNVLQLTAQLCRALGGGRVVMCKSAKDRTGMAVTLEQAQLLRQHHGLDFVEVPRVASLLRLHGTRPENALKNIGERMFAFNALQRRLLPVQYRPPSHVAGRRAS